MIYVLTNEVEKQTWWGLATRRYLKALYEVGVDFRVVWRSGAGIYREDLEPEFQFLFDGKPGEEYEREVIEYKRRWWSFKRKPVVRKIREKSTISFFGGTSEPSECTLFIGDLNGACEAMMDELNRGPRNIALVHWPEMALATHQVDMLNMYDRILVPGNIDAFVDSGVKNVHSIQFPSPPIKRMALDDSPEVLVAVGKWGGHDNVREAFEWYIKKYTAEDPVVLNLICDSVPFTEDLEEGLPKIVIDQIGLLRDSQSWDAIFGQAHRYIGASTRHDFDPYNCMAQQDTTYKSLGLELSRHIAQTTREATMPIAFVIPHKDRGVDQIDETLGNLAPQLKLGDEVIVVDHHSSNLRELTEFCTGENISLVRTVTDDLRWSIARARNAGARAARILGCEAVMFLDCDINLPEGFVDHMREKVRSEERLVYIPRVAEGGRINRIGSGIAAMQLDLFEEAGEYDESFIEHGGEDIEFLYRAKTLCQTNEYVSPYDPVYHRPHPRQHNQANEDRVKNLLSADPEAVTKPQNEREFEWIVKQGEKCW